MMNIKSLVVAVSLITTFPVTAAHAWCSPKPYDGYILEGETASDPRTGLTWMRCVVGQKWDAQKQKCAGEPTKINWFSAVDAAIAERSGAKDDWRLPSSAEIKFLFDCRKTSWAYGSTLYATNFDVFQLPGNRGNQHSGLRYDWYGALWSASSPGVFDYVYEPRELRNFFGFNRAKWAETFSFKGRELADRHATLWQKGDDPFDGFYALLVRGGASPNMLFEKAKERRNAQAQFDDAVINAARMIKEHEIQRIEYLEKELSAIDHKQ